ncbi:MAG: methionine aminotransferase [Cyclobacteriaceae bacterium]
MIQSKLPDTGTTIFSIMSGMANRYRAINLSQGFPDFPVSPDLIELTARAMRDGHNQYAPMPGVPLLRERIANKIRITGGREVDIDSEITVTSGATEALFATIMALVSTGDEVVILEPCYDSYIPAIKLAGGIPVPVQLTEPDFSVDWELVGRSLSDRTKLLVINSPHNPTGSTLSEQDLQALITLTEKYPQLLILSDEVYEHIIFDERKHHSVLNYPELEEKAIAVFSFGKTFHATGWKIGYCVAAPFLTEEIRKIHQYLTFSVHTPTQIAMANYLENEENYLSLSKYYQKKRDLFLENTKGSLFKPIKSTGTYFQLMDYSQITDEPDTKLAERLVKEYRLAAIPVSVFYTSKHDPKCLRFCFAKQDDTLLQAGEIIRSIDHRIL